MLHRERREILQPVGISPHAGAASCLLAMLLYACAADGPQAETQPAPEDGASSPSARADGENAWFDFGSEPPVNTIKPPGAIRVPAAPLKPDDGFLPGTWAADNGCLIRFDADGPGGLSGAASASPGCAGPLAGAAFWVVEPEHKIRLVLNNADGAPVWAGLAADAGTLSGFLPGHGAIVLRRQAGAGE